VHYVVLDDVFTFGGGYIGYLTQPQLDWLTADLALVETGRTVVVFMHIPSYCTQHVRTGKERPERSVVVVNRELLNQLLAPYRSHIVVGHMHETEHLTDAGIHIHVCGAVCGAWWTGPICGDGTPNGYGVYTVQGEDVRWRYKSTGLPADEQMRVYSPGAAGNSPDEFMVNIWDWDPDWTVVWFEDGMKKGTMTKKLGTDPLSVQLHQGPNLPRKHAWVEPYITGHLFTARPSPATRRFTVEATNRWGKTFAVHSTMSHQ
jgi:hypothetical protein